MNIEDELRSIFNVLYLIFSVLFIFLFFYIIEMIK